MWRTVDKKQLTAVPGHFINQHILNHAHTYALMWIFRGVVDLLSIPLPMFLNKLRKRFIIKIFLIYYHRMRYLYASIFIKIYKRKNHNRYSKGNLREII